ncbi:Alpha/Beta hydrolase protein [Penicillium chermesinum]|nr:Alpha/Beta hydrolase protein [Penicillium chermesinum]
MATYTEHEVTYAGGKKIHYLAAGPVNGPLVLFIHGWPATAITWRHQLDAFAAVGFRAVAPDMPGYGQSTSRRLLDDYCQEALVEGNDGSPGRYWPQSSCLVKALVSICVPYSTLELGWDQFLPLVNRDIYPEDEYEFGQWDYMRRYEEEFEEAVAWCNKDIAGYCNALMQKPGARPDRTLPAHTAKVRREGPLGGREKPPSVDMTGPPMLPAEVWDSFIKDMERTGFWTGCAYYMHHQRNAEYNGKKDRRLKQPVLFVHATWDLVCDTKTSRLIEPMREACSDLTEVTLDASHWVPFEKPRELNAALFRFIVNSLPSEWPGFWDSGYTTRKSDL